MQHRFPSDCSLASKGLAKKKHVTLFHHSGDIEQKNKVKQVLLPHGHSYCSGSIVLLKFWRCVLNIAKHRLQVCSELKASDNHPWAWWEEMTTSGPAAPRHLHCLDPPLHRTEVKRKSEVNFRETVVTFKSNGNVTTGLSEEQVSSGLPIQYW